MNKTLLARRLHILLIGTLLVTASTPGCTANLPGTKGTGTKPKASEVAAQPGASARLERISQEQQQDIKQNEAELEHQLEEIKKLRLRLSEY